MASPAQSEPTAGRRVDRQTVVAAVLRAALLSLCALLVGFAPDGDRGAVALAVVATAALLSTLTSRTRWRWRVAIAVELVAAALAVPFTGGSTSPLLPYLLAPMFAVGFQAGVLPTLVAAAAVLSVLLSSVGAALPMDEFGRYGVTAAEWSVLGLALGLIAAWARSLLTLSQDPKARFVEAYRLLSELRGIARRLPGSLDPVSAANALLDGCADIAPVHRAGVLVPTSTNRLAPIVVRGAERLDLDLAADGPGPVGVASRSREAVVEGSRDVRSGMASLVVVPLPSGGPGSGVVVLEAESPSAYPRPVVDRLTAAIREAAPRLDSALLFDEIRSFATVEERQRLAREIHDGIAQELVYVGYELDNLAADVGAGRPETAQAVRQVREQLTRMISELRLSIFNLRSTVDPQAGLGAALTEYVRTVGSDAGLTVHVSLTEAGNRMPPDVEAELLRIAQESIGNARKHAQARNLWVRLVVDPPYARLVVEDDGTGAGPGPRPGGFGLEIMQERATRLGARLTIGPRPAGGTRVDVTLGREA